MKRFVVFRWAADTVFTRQNQIPSEEDPETKVPALIPVWDMANHVYGPISSGYNSETSCCDCFSLAPRQKGLQVGQYIFITSNSFFTHMMAKIVKNHCTEKKICYFAFFVYLLEVKIMSSVQIELL